MPPAGRLAAATAVLVVLAMPAAAGAKRAYTTTPGPADQVGSFSVRYSGEGAYHTDYRGHPPNPGGADDHNTAHDRSEQNWAIRYHGRLDVPACDPAAGDLDPCTQIQGLDGARGATAMTGWVR